MQKQKHPELPKGLQTDLKILGDPLDEIIYSH